MCHRELVELMSSVLGKRQFKGLMAMSRSRKRRKVSRAPRSNLRNFKRTLAKILEKKQFNINVSTYTFSSTPTVVVLYSPTPGSASTQRLGLNTSMNSFYLNAHIVKAEAATTTSCRLMVIWDRNPSGATPAANSILDTSVIPAALVAPVNLAFSNRFKILIDERFVITADNGAVYVQRYLNLNHDMYTTKFKGSAGTVADIESGGLFIMTMSDEGTNTPVSQVSTRVRFVDA